MKIGELNQNCKNCKIIGHCGILPTSKLQLCTDNRFKDVDEEKFIELLHQTDSNNVDKQKYDRFMEDANSCEDAKEFEYLQLEFYNNEFAHQTFEMIQEENK